MPSKILGKRKTIEECLLNVHDDCRELLKSGKIREVDKCHFICPNGHGDYWQVLRGYRVSKYCCPKAGNAVKGRGQATTNYPWLHRVREDYQEKIRNGEINNKAKIPVWCDFCKEYHFQVLQSVNDGRTCRKQYYAQKAKENGKKQRKTNYPFLDLLSKKQKEDVLAGNVKCTDYAVFYCEKHGNYEKQFCDADFNGWQCPKCSAENNGIRCRKNDYDFLGEVREDYRQKIVNKELKRSDKVPFFCEAHGEYWQTINSRNIGAGCPICALNKRPYSFYEFLKTFTENIIINDRTQIRPLEIDFFLPEYNIGFEFNDIKTHQTHFEEQKTNDILREYDKPSNYHYKKYLACKEKGIRLIQIWDVEWGNERIRPILESVIKNALGFNESKLFARKCELVESNSKECNAFFEQNHIQGAAKGKGYFALKYNGEIVGAICYANKIKTVKKNNENNAEITISRMAFKQGYSVVGGASRLLNAVMQTMNSGETIEYLVLNDYFDGVSFDKTGWEKAKRYSMVRYYDVENRKSYYRHPSKYQERKQKCVDGKMQRYYTSGTTVYRKQIK